MQIMKIAMLIAFAIVASAIQVVTADPYSERSFLLASGSSGKLAVDGPGDITTDPLTTPDLSKSKDKREPEDIKRPSHPVAVLRESSYSELVQYLFAFTWIIMLAAIPFITPVIDKKAVTRSQVAVGSCMLAVLFGGLFLFTNIILFQSVHFEGIRPLTIIECIYFMSQVITTVGYGDIGPAKVRGQIFVGLYVLGALFIISMLVSDLTNHMIQMAKEYREKLAQKQQAAQQHAQPTVHSLVCPAKPSANGLIFALAVFAALDLTWIMFFSFHPEEEKTTFQAMYMSVITLSTVGLGAFTPVTETGMIFGAFFMLFGSCALVNVITNFTELMVKLNEWERFKPDSYSKSLRTLDGLTHGKTEVTEEQFLEFTLMQMKLVSQSELDTIHQAFEQLNPEGRLGSHVRKVSMRAIRQSLNVGGTPK